MTCDLKKISSPEDAPASSSQEKSKPANDPVPFLARSALECLWFGPLFEESEEGKDQAKAFGKQDKS